MTKGTKSKKVEAPERISAKQLQTELDKKTAQLKRTRQLLVEAVQLAKDESDQLTELKLVVALRDKFKENERALFIEVLTETGQEMGQLYALDDGPMPEFGELNNILDVLEDIVPSGALADHFIKAIGAGYAMARMRPS